MNTTETLRVAIPSNSRLSEDLKPLFENMGLEKTETPGQLKSNKFRGPIFRTMRVQDIARVLRIETSRVGILGLDTMLERNLSNTPGMNPNNVLTFDVGTTRMTMLVRKEDLDRLPQVTDKSAGIITSYPNITEYAVKENISNNLRAWRTGEQICMTKPERYVVSSIIRCCPGFGERQQRPPTAPQLERARELSIAYMRGSWEELRAKLAKENSYWDIEAQPWPQESRFSPPQVPRSAVIRTCEGKVEEMLRNGDIKGAVFAVDLIRSGKTAEECDLIPYGDPIVTSQPGLYFSNDIEKENQLALEVTCFITECAQKADIVIKEGLGKNCVQNGVQKWKKP